LFGYGYLMPLSPEELLARFVVRRHRHGAGWASVVHRESGELLGEVCRWDDGVWCSYIVRPDGKIDDSAAAADSATRGEAVEALFDPAHWLPPMFRGRFATDPQGRSDEQRSRNDFPKEWALFDKVCGLLSIDPRVWLDERAFLKVDPDEEGVSS
jgi:hypothetical protein